MLCDHFAGRKIIRSKINSSKKSCREQNADKVNDFFTTNHPSTVMKSVRKKELAIQSGTLLKASFLFEAAIHPMRLQLLNLLIAHGGLTATSIFALLDIESDTGLQQLSILCGVGLLLRNTESEEVFYTVNYEKLDQLYRCAEALLIRL